LLLLLTALVWWRIAATRAAAQNQRGKFAPQVISAVQAVTRDMPLYLNALGTVTPNNTVTVHSMVNGQLQRIAFVEGGMVKAGQLLVELDPRPYQVQLAQAQGQLLHDQALLANAQIDLTRYQTLQAQNSIAEQQVAAQASLVKQYQGSVITDRAAVDNARLQLVYCRISAPVSGRVGLKQVDLGNIVHSSDANGVVVITQMQPTNVLFSIPEDDLSQVLPALNAHQPLLVEAWDRGNLRKLAEGKLLTADNQVSASTGTVALKAVFSNADNILFPQQFVNVRLRTEVRRNAVVIPLAAMQRGQPGTFVYLVKPDHTVSLRVIVAGPTSGDQLIVNSGLVAGDRVVLDGVDRLREGARVILAGGPGAAPAAGAAAWKGKHHHAANPA
jgi:multidrug efflux system membrane fusion protein